ncbi:MAG: hypothetical protein WCK89_02510 [bacterium]
MKARQVLGVMMGAALLSGTAFAEPAGPQGQEPRDDGPGMRPPFEGQPGACIRRGAPGQEDRPGMMPGCRQEKTGNPGVQSGGPGPGMEIGRRPFLNPQRLKEAGATDQQLEALKTFANEQQLKQIDLRAAVEKAELTLNQLMSSETLDEKAALKAVDTLNQARAEIFKMEVSSKLKTRGILGKEVEKKLREMGPPEGKERQGRGPRTEGQVQPRKDAPPAGDRPPLQ